jgi:hypothetical protein
MEFKQINKPSKSLQHFHEKDSNMDEKFSKEIEILKKQQQSSGNGGHEKLNKTTRSDGICLQF